MKINPKKIISIALLILMTAAAASVGDVQYKQDSAGKPAENDQNRETAEKKITHKRPIITTYDPSDSQEAEVEVLSEETVNTVLRQITDQIETEQKARYGKYASVKDAVPSAYEQLKTFDENRDKWNADSDTESVSFSVYDFDRDGLLELTINNCQNALPHFYHAVNGDVVEVMRDDSTSSAKFSYDKWDTFGDQIYYEESTGRLYYDIFQSATIKYEQAESDSYKDKIYDESLRYGYFYLDDEGCHYVPVLHRHKMHVDYYGKAEETEYTDENDDKTADSEYRNLNQKFIDGKEELTGDLGPYTVSYKPSDGAKSTLLPSLISSYQCGKYADDTPAFNGSVMLNWRESSIKKDLHRIISKLYTDRNTELCKNLTDAYTDMFYQALPPEDAKAMEPFLPALKNETEIYFYTDDFLNSDYKKTTLSEWVTDEISFFTPLKVPLWYSGISFIDINDDAKKELVLYAYHDNYHIVLHEEKGTVYAYASSYRAFMDLQSNGYHESSDGGSAKSFYSLGFRDGHFTEPRLASYDYRDEEFLYYISGKSVSEAEFDNYMKKTFYQAGSPKWYMSEDFDEAMEYIYAFDDRNTALFPAEKFDLFSTSRNEWKTEPEVTCCICDPIGDGTPILAVRSGTPENALEDWTLYHVYEEENRVEMLSDGIMPVKDCTLADWQAMIQEAYESGTLYTFVCVTNESRADLLCEFILGYQKNTKEMLMTKK